MYSSGINAHALETLEFSKVIASVARQCLTAYGREKVEAIAPGFSLPEIEKRQTEISQMKDIVSFGSALPLYRLEDCRDLLKRSRVQGTFLVPEELKTVLEFLEVGIALYSYDKEGRPKFPAVDAYLKQIRPFPELKKQIVSTIDETGNVKDSASPALKKLRLELHDARRKLLVKLENILSGQRKVAGWQDDVVTQRNGRYVIPVISSQFRNDLGILHDRSQSGATLYVEPVEVVEMNNRLGMLQQEERVEVDRILRALTAEIGNRADSLLENAELIGQLDFLHAAARFAVILKATKPEMVADARLSLIDARHPLLIEQFRGVDKVVPMSVALDNDRRVILITGPNTGGKTVALKTVGLLTLMAQAGLLISASERSEMGMFSQVFADIGDEQSIELSLSTFSSHIRNIIEAIRGATESTLLLFDEIGAGTDPKEGAALAEAVINRIVEVGAKLIATTHYSQLKTLALSQPEVENASLEFDRKTLAPTYALQVGLPGSSYAVEIAARLGMPEDIVKKAGELVGSGERSLSELITSLQADLKSVREEKILLSERLAKAREIEDKYKRLFEELQAGIADEKRRALAETTELLEKTRKEAERLVAEIRQTQAAKAKVKELHQTLRASTEQVNEEQQKLQWGRQTAHPTTDVSVGDNVHILTLDATGVVNEVLSDNRARVAVGNVSTIVDFRNLRPIDPGPGKKAPKSVKSDVQADSGAEIHLRGMTVEEAISALDRFIDRAVVQGLHQIYVIHGKGTGTLRRVLTKYLREHREVDSLRLGDWNEGGAGVTIVKLKT